MHTLRGHRFAFPLGALVLLLLALPYAQATFLGDAALVILFALVLVAGVFAAAESRASLGLGLLLAAPAVALDLAALASDGAGLRMAGGVFAVAFFAYVIVQLSRAVFWARDVHGDLLAGAVCIYLLLAMTWTSLYEILETASPGSFAPAPTAGDPWPDLMFFSLTALTTVGYGDIVPVSGQARSLASLESAVGVLYPAILVARLVGRLRIGGE